MIPIEIETEEIPVEITLEQTDDRQPTFQTPRSPPAIAPAANWDMYEDPISSDHQNQVDHVGVLVQPE